MPHRTTYRIVVFYFLSCFWQNALTAAIDDVSYRNEVGTTTDDTLAKSQTNEDSDDYINKDEDDFTEGSTDIGTYVPETTVEEATSVPDDNLTKSQTNEGSGDYNSGDYITDDEDDLTYVPTDFTYVPTDITYVPTDFTYVPTDVGTYASETTVAAATSVPDDGFAIVGHISHGDKWYEISVSGKERNVQINKKTITVTDVECKLSYDIASQTLTMLYMPTGERVEIQGTSSLTSSDESWTMNVDAKVPADPKLTCQSRDRFNTFAVDSTKAECLLVGEQFQFYVDSETINYYYPNYMLSVAGKRRQMKEHGQSRFKTDPTETHYEDGTLRLKWTANRPKDYSYIVIDRDDNVDVVLNQTRTIYRRTYRDLFTPCGTSRWQTSNGSQLPVLAFCGELSGSHEVFDNYTYLNAKTPHILGQAIGDVSNGIYTYGQYPVNATVNYWNGFELFADFSSGFQLKIVLK